MFKLAKLIQLHDHAKAGSLEPFFTLYETYQFGPKYQLLADILYARQLIEVGKNDEAVAGLKDGYERLKTHLYFNDDTKIYISNFIAYYCHQAWGHEGYRIDPRERPLNMKKVNGSVRSIFFHMEDYSSVSR